MTSYKALTVCEPYASLLLLPDSDPRCKRVENRRWRMQHRGWLVIHAGKSKNYLRQSAPGVDDWGLTIADMQFGKAVGLVNVVDCLQYNVAQKRFIETRAYEQYPWLKEHRHIEGEFCIIVDQVRKFTKPFEFRGQLSLFEIPADKVEAAL